MELLHCERCGHEWYPRKPQRPRRCAKCTALYWNRPARIPKTPREVGAIGRPMLFPGLAALEVGQVLLLPWVALPNGQPDNAANARHLPAVNYHARKNGWHVNTWASAAGLKVERLP